MSDKQQGFILTPPPHLFSDNSIPKVMYAVVVALLPALVMSVLYFGVRVLGLYVVGVATCMATEAVTKIVRRQNWKSILDGSAVLTGLLLVMCMPPSSSPILVALGSVVAIFVGKEVFGGLGANVFNPALVGRAFLAAAYPVQMTTWTEPNQVFGFLARGADAVSGATPLAAGAAQEAPAEYLRLLFGQHAGSIGETGALFLLAGAVLLMIINVVRWPIVVSYLGSVAVFGGIFWLVDPAAYPDPLFHLLSGGLMLGALYMATDLVTSPVTVKGSLVFGAGAGIIVVIIRLFGGLPEGVAYSILLMNAVTPIINRYMNNRVYGAVKPAKEHGA
jgi:Na+-translocating ferredoxin:NAD+ oxidoreductase subunit D